MSLPGSAKPVPRSLPFLVNDNIHPGGASWVGVRVGSGGREQPVLGWALWAPKQKAPPALVTLSLALGTGFALAVCLPGARGRGTQVTGDAVTRLAFVTDDGSRIYGTQKPQENVSGKLTQPFIPQEEK